MRNQLEKTNSQNAELRAKIEEIESYDASRDADEALALVQIRQQKEEIEEKCKKLESELSESRNDYEKVLQEKEEIQVKILSIESSESGRIAELEEIVENQKAKIKDILLGHENEIQNHMNEIGNMRSIITTQKAEYEAKLAESQSIIDTQKISLDDLEKEKEFLFEKMKELEIKCLDLESRRKDTADKHEEEHKEDSSKEEITITLTKGNGLDTNHNNGNGDDNDEVKSIKERLEKAENELRMIRRGVTPYGWVQRNEIHENPPPSNLSIRSPEIQQIFNEWTQDRANMQFMTQWCSRILSGDDITEKSGFQSGVELTKMSTAARDGFLTIIVPMLLRRSDIDIQCHTREVPKVLHELRIRVVPKQKSQNSLSSPNNGSAKKQSNNNESLNGKRSQEHIDNLDTTNGHDEAKPKRQLMQ